jgi:hypothetical protein
MAKAKFMTPVGRLVLGNPYKPFTKDADGKPLTFKNGEPRVKHFAALAIPKDIIHPVTRAVSRPDWKQTEWGSVIYAAGAEAFPAAHKLPHFAWKIVDGDDQTPKGPSGRRACDNEGFPGNWILKFETAYAAKIFRSDSGAYVQVTEDGFIKTGHYIQIHASVVGNGSQQKPGIILNQEMIAFSGYGEVIQFGADANSVGFGQAPLPVGASAVPIAATDFPYGVAPAISNIPTSSTQVVPNPAFLNVPAPPSAAPTMTAKAAGASYQAFKAAGWDDAKLVAEGFMV